MSNKPKIDFLLIDGTADARIQATISQWVGIAYRIPRKLLSNPADTETLKRALTSSGIYLLFGTYDSEDKEVVYVGQVGPRANIESPLLTRIKEHIRDGKKQFFNEVIFFTTVNDSLGSTELCYLESQFYKLASAQGYIVHNGNTPPEGNITETEQYGIEPYIENAKMILSLLGYKVFDSTYKGGKTYPEKSVKLFLSTKVRGESIQAKALWTNKGFIVLAGSQIAFPETERTGTLDSVRELREMCKKNKEIVKNAQGKWILKKDQEFRSPSRAGTFVLTGTINGNDIWKTKDGKKFGELEK